MDFSISSVIRQNTLGQSEGFPAGVPRSYNWYKGWNGQGLETPPADFTAVEGWGQVYQRVGAPEHSNPDATVEVANAKTYVHVKQSGEWVLVQDQSKIQMTGGHFVPDFAGNAGYPMKMTPLAGGGTTFSAPPAGYNDHFWYKSRGTYAAGTVDAVYVQMDLRVTDPDLNLIASVGADWWRDANAPYLQDHSNNPGIGSSNWVELSTQWRTLGYYSMNAAQFQTDLPPPLRGSPFETSPTISSFSPDSGAVGDGITNATVLTLAGTAEAGTTVKVFDGTTGIGTVKASASGTWTLTTRKLSDATHNFTVRTTNAAGNTSQTAPALSVRVDTKAPAAPKITSFSRDSSTVGDGIITANHLTLAGKAEAGSTVKVFDGGSHIGTATASASGAWSFTTARLSNAPHKFTATATDAAGNTSSASRPLNARVDAAGVSSSLSSPAPSDEDLLLNGPSRAPSAGADERTESGGIDGFHQTAQPVAMQSNSLSFAVHSWPGFSGSTEPIQIVWNDCFVLVPLVLGAIIKIHRNGPLDRFKCGSSAEGMRALRRDRKCG